MYVPDDVAEWLKQPGAMEELRKFMRRCAA
jgi:hypothetical protein